MLRAFVELVVASVRLARARLRGLLDPCPPHSYRDGLAFCLKCGEYRRDSGG